MRFSNPYLSDVQKANLLQRWIIVHSILYYVRDQSFVEDRKFDENEKQLVDLLESMSESERKRTKYWYVFYDFDGSTGFNLYGRLKNADREFLDREADHALRLSRCYFKRYV